MNALTKSGRIIFALPFLFFGLFHFMGASKMSAVVPEYLPGGVFWVYLTGAAHILASLAMLFNKFAKIASILLAIMLILFALMTHLPAALNGEQMEMANVLKNIALAGGALIVAGLSE